MDYQQLVLANNEYKQENKISEEPQADAVDEKKESKRRKEEKLNQLAQPKSRKQLYTKNQVRGIIDKEVD
jgi:iron uptake system EfeUOB component EfeO/EfeM